MYYMRMPTQEQWKTVIDMRIPTQEQWKTVIDKLYSVLPFALKEGSLDMEESKVNGNPHVCGTTHCVGGWYAIAHWRDRAFDRMYILYFSDGGNQLAKDLGFEDRHYLAQWAYYNKEIWGNENGDSMFWSEKAYDHDNGPAKDLCDVIHHFELVADNCKKIKP